MAAMMGITYRRFDSLLWRGLISSAPVERERYKPRIIEVNYIEGSNDKRWSSRDFPWTKKLEVKTCIDDMNPFALC